MKLFIADRLLSWADLIDAVVEVLSFGLVRRTDVGHVVQDAAADALCRAGWISWSDLP